MNDILKEIIENKKIEVNRFKQITNLPHLKNLAETSRNRPSMAESIKNSETGIIAEFKRKSPSLGWIKQNANPVDIVKSYAKAGAVACSILTNSNYFGGEIEDLRNVAENIEFPLLRKEFIIDECQIFEAKVNGASAILLIAACLEQKQCYDLAATAKAIGLDVLLEIHNENELNFINHDTNIIGINNRNLRNFKTNIETSIQLIDKLPQDVIKISESGISSSNDIKTLKNVGFNGFLIGESFMKTENPGNALEHFVEELNIKTE